MDKDFELMKLEARLLYLEGRGKYIKCPGVVRKIKRKIAKLKELD